MPVPTPHFPGNITTFKTFMHLNNANFIGSQINEVHGIQLNNFSNDESDLARAFGALQSMNVPDAKYDSRNRRVPPCLHDTRIDILTKVKQWLLEPQDHAVCWLHGMAGTGKSAIAQSISEFCAREGKLAASFFFDRQQKDRSIADSLVATIAYQLTTTIPELKRPICEALKRDESILNGVLDTQLQKLVTEPLKSLSGSDFPVVIIIDALDECEHSHVTELSMATELSKVAKILTTLADPATNPHFMFRLFITSRPEPHIQVLLETLATLKFSLQDFNPDSDIRSYIAEELDDIRRVRQSVILESSWPSSTQLDSLVEKSSGLFIYASTVVKFIGDERRNPKRQLETILNMENHTGPDTYSDLDRLYKQVLLGFPDSSKHMVVLGTIILLQDPLSPQDIALILGQSLEDVLLPLERLHSILSIPQDPRTGHVTILHRSLDDFLTSRKRAGVYFIDPSLTHANLAKCCLDCIINTLPKYPSINFLLPGCHQLLNCWHAVKEHCNLAGPSVTRYACLHWVFHFTRSPATSHWTHRLTRLDPKLYGIVKTFCRYYVFSWRMFLEMDGLYNVQLGYEQIPERRRDRERVLEQNKSWQRARFWKGFLLLFVVMGGMVGASLFVALGKTVSTVIAFPTLISIILLPLVLLGVGFVSGRHIDKQLRRRSVRRSVVQVQRRIDNMNVLVSFPFYLAFTNQATRMLELQISREAGNNAPDERV